MLTQPQVQRYAVESFWKLAAKIKTVFPQVSPLW